MIRWLCLGSLMLIAGCSVAPNTLTATPTASPFATTTLAPTRIIVPQNTPLPLTGIPSPSITPASSARTGWRTFIHPTLQLAVDYPPEWSVNLQDNVATFTSPQNIPIRLMPIDLSVATANDDLALPNTRCTKRTNPYGVAVRTCLATIGMSIDAYLIFQSSGIPPSAAMFSTTTRNSIDNLNALVDSARPAK